MGIHQNWSFSDGETNATISNYQNHPFFGLIVQFSTIHFSGHDFDPGSTLATGDVAPLI